MKKGHEKGSCAQPFMHELLTVLIQTSPIPSHPSTALLEALFRSFEKADGLLECKVIVLADGCDVIPSISASTSGSGRAKENNKHGQVTSETSQRYEEHLELLSKKIQSQTPPFVPQGQGAIELVRLPVRHGSARAIHAALMERPNLIATPLVLIGQHDNFFVRSTPLRDIVRAYHQTPGFGIGATCVHFLSTSTLNYLDKIKRRYGMQELRPVQTDTCLPYPLIPLIFWYGRTHLSTTAYYREYVFQKYPLSKLQPKDHLEELFGPTQLQDILKRGPKAHAEYGTYVLDQGNEQVLYHLSGRRATAIEVHSPLKGENDEKNPPRDEKPIVHASQDNSFDDGTNAVTSVASDHAVPTIHGSSFTTARSCRAIVPGLTIIEAPPSKEDNRNNNSSKGGRKPFKQKCFHCGVKGHSFKFCPDTARNTAHPIASETIDLS